MSKQAGTAVAVPTAVEGELQRSLAECEEVIESGLGTFVDVGNALGEIHDARLYVGEYTTFEDYAWQRWGLSRAYAYRQIDAAEVVALVSPIGDIKPPANESVARPLTLLRDDNRRIDADRVCRTWKAVARLSSVPKAEQVGKVVAAIKHVPRERLGAVLDRVITEVRRGGGARARPLPSANGGAGQQHAIEDAPEHDDRPHQFLAAPSAIYNLPPAQELYESIPQHAWDQLDPLDAVIRKLMDVRRLLQRDRAG